MKHIVVFSRRWPLCVEYSGECGRVVWLQLQNYPNFNQSICHRWSPEVSQMLRCDGKMSHPSICDTSSVTCDHLWHRSQTMWQFYTVMYWRGYFTVDVSFFIVGYSWLRTNKLSSWWWCFVKRGMLMMIFQGGCFVYGGSTDQQKGDRMPFITIWSADHLQIVIFIISLYHLSIPQILIVIIGWGRNLFWCIFSTTHICIGCHHYHRRHLKIMIMIMILILIMILITTLLIDSEVEAQSLIWG